MNSHDSNTQNFSDLEALTVNFFERHWDKTSVTPWPTWKNNWKWTGSVPYHDKAGVYALLDSELRILYVGVGTSTGSKYPEHGISRRLLAHVIKGNPTYKAGEQAQQYIPKSKWNKTGVKHIGAVGFPKEFAYLALALEAFLIEKLAPPENRRK